MAEEREEPNGGNDLMAFFGLSRLYAYAQSKFVPEPYLRGLAGDTALRRYTPRLCHRPRCLSVPLTRAAAPWQLCSWGPTCKGWQLT